MSPLALGLCGMVQMVQLFLVLIGRCPLADRGCTFRYLLEDSVGGVGLLLEWGVAEI